MTDNVGKSRQPMDRRHVIRIKPGERDARVRLSEVDKVLTQGGRRGRAEIAPGSRTVQDDLPRTDQVLASRANLTAAGHEWA